MTDLVVSFAAFFFENIAINATGKVLDLIQDAINKEEDVQQKIESALKLSLKNIERSSTYDKDVVNTLFSDKKKIEIVADYVFTQNELTAANLVNALPSLVEHGQFLEELLIELRKNFLKDEILRRIVTDNELYISVQSINRTLKEISRISLLQKDVLDSLYKDSRKSKDAVRKEIRKFINIYSKLLLKSIEEVNFVNLGLRSGLSKERKKLSEIYVEPTFTFEAKPNEEETIGVERIIDDNQRTVIIGAAGSGKSILAKYIALRSFGKVDEFDQTRVTFILSLRDYLSRKNKENLNFLSFIHQEVESGLGISVSRQVLERIFQARDTIIIFDGLDEIYDPNDKLKVRNDIVSFSVLYPKVRPIVTSRIAGYNDVAFDNTYKLYKIDSFDKSRIKSFISNWYSVLAGDYSGEKNVLQKDIFSIKSELTSNPLLLTLIVILYRNNLRLPESRLEIYESCTDTLINSWDRSKRLDIGIESSLLNKKVSILTDLAFWQYEASSKTEDGSITYSLVKHKISEIITKKLEIDDWSVIEDYASRFLEYLERRSIYIENNFTHKTFIEYYTARYIFQSLYIKPSKRKDFYLTLDKYIGNSYWSVVFELLLNMIDNIQNDNSELNEILVNLIAKNEKAYALVVQNIFSLNNVSQSIRESILKESVLKCIEDLEYNELTQNDHESDRNREVFNIFESIRLTLIHDAAAIEMLGEILNSILNEHVGESEAINFFSFVFEISYHLGTSKLFDEKIMLESAQVANSKVLLVGYFNWQKINRSEDCIKYIKESIECFGESSIYNYAKTYFSSGAKWLSPLEEYLTFYVFHEQLDPKVARRNFYALIKIVPLNELLPEMVSNNIYIRDVTDSLVELYRKYYKSVRLRDFIEINIFLFLQKIYSRMEDAKSQYLRLRIDKEYLSKHSPSIEELLTELFGVVEDGRGLLLIDKYTS